MKSRILSFNVLIETVKRQIWIPALLTLGFFLCIPVAGIIMLGWDQANGTPQAEMIGSYIVFLAGTGLPFYGIMTIGSAMLTGVSGFSWLHSRAQTDFYHSLPVRREKLFVSQVILDVAYFALPFLLNLLLAYAIGAASGILSGRAVRASLTSFLFQILFYLLIHFVVVLAMLLSGKLLAGVTGAVVLLFYGPLMDLVLRGMAETFFETYANKGLVFSKFLQSFSPIVKYIQMYSVKRYPSMSGKALAVSLLVTAALAVLCFCLYKKRPSESAGRTVAFYRIGKGTQYMIEVLVILGIGIIFYSVAAQMRNGWMVFGILLGGVMSHGIMEVIQDGDIRQLMAHKWVLTASLATSLAVFGIFYGDIFRYDDFLPKQEKLEAVRIKADDNYDPTELGHNDEQMEAMKRMAADPDVYETLQMLLKNRVERETMVDMRGAVKTQGESSHTRYVEVEYVLSGGQTVYRSYLVDYGQCRQRLMALLGSQDYKKTVYPLMTLTEEEMQERLHSVDVTSINGNQEEIPGNEEMRTEFLKIYRADLLQMTGETLEKEYPIGTIHLFANWNYKDETGQGMTGSMYSMLANREYYIYPSFTGTLAWLKEKGIELPESFRPEEIEYITVYNSDDTGDAGDEIVRDKKQIQELIPYLVSYDMDDGLKDDQAYVLAVVRVKKDGYSEDISCRLMKKRKPSAAQ